MAHIRGVTVAPGTALGLQLPGKGLSVGAAGGEQGKEESPAAPLASSQGSGAAVRGGGGSPACAGSSQPDVLNSTYFLGDIPLFRLNPLSMSALLPQRTNRFT